jgi:WD40 repeat protein
MAHVGRTRQAVIGAGDGMLWLMEEGGKNASVPDAKFDTAPVSAIAGCSAGGKFALVGTEAGAVLVYSLEGRRRPPVALGVHKGAVRAVAFAADGTKAVSVGEDKAVRVWDLKTGRESRRLVGHAGGVSGVALSADGRRAVTAGEDGTVRVWDTLTGQEVRRFVGHKGKVNAVAFSPDGRRVVSGGEDMTVRVWGL